LQERARRNNIAVMTEQENPDQPTLDLLRQAVELHCRKHVALGPEDAEEWFFELAHDVWKQCAAGQWDAYVRERRLLP
jgi:hypothetical protein